MPNYLFDLTTKIAAGVERIPADARDRHANYVAIAQQPDGGWRGREGNSDLYYTGFALRTLAITGRLRGELAERAANYLRGKLAGHETIVDFLSLIYAATLLDLSAGIDLFAAAPTNWRDNIAATLEKLRRDDGGYAKGMEGTASSTYHSFLVLLCLQAIERPIPQPEKLVAFLMSQRAEEGGFREIRAAKRAGTNPTAAAIGALRMLNAVDANLREETLDFLANMQTDEGGLRANTRIPIADVLSTFTGLVTLLDLGELDAIDLAAARKFVVGLQLPAGGFAAATWDPAGDVEYTFYGLGSWGLLS